MKNIALFLVVFVFVFGLFITNFNKASALSIIAGCRAGDLYNRFTGDKCWSEPVCAPGEKYNSKTGALCPNEESQVVISGVSGPQSLNINKTGTWKVEAYDSNGGDLFYSVSWGDEGYMTTSGMTAWVPAQQSATFTHKYSQAGTYTVQFVVKNEAGESAETSLSVNVGGTISNPIVKFNYFSTDEDTYRFELSSNQTFDKVRIEPDCSDRGNIYISSYLLGKQVCRSFSASLRPTNGISHTLTLYSTDSRTHYATVWAYAYYKNVLIGTQALQVKINPIENDYPSITVLSPNGGETWAKGTIQYIKWKDNTIPTTNSCGPGCTISPYPPKYYDVTLEGNASCSGDFCTLGFPVYTIAKNITSSSYSWTVGKVLGLDKYIPDGAYRMSICQSGTSTCDSSDNYFKIQSNTIARTCNASIYWGDSSWYPQRAVQYGDSAKETWKVIGADQVWGDCGDGSKQISTGPQSYTFQNMVAPRTCKVWGVIDGSTACSASATINVYASGDLPQPYTPAVPAGTVGGYNYDSVRGAESFRFTQRLQFGSTGNEVMELQKYLNSNGYNAGNVDGKFGLKTQTALVKFQVANSLKADGIVSTEVQALLNK